MSTESGIVIERSKITVDNVGPHTYKKEKGIFSAQLRQSITKTYPSVRVNTGGLFNVSDFNLPDGQEFTSTRVAWIDVPENTTVKRVEELIAKLPEAVIYTVLSNNVMDVLSEGQRSAITAGMRTLEEFEEKYRIKTTAGEELEGYDEEGKAQYKQNFFSTKAHVDVDLRTYKNASASANMVSATADTNEGQKVI